MQTNITIPWPDWELVRLIGHGSFGAVYEIQRDLFGRKEKAALKHIGLPQNETDVDELYSEGYDEESVSASLKRQLRSIVEEYSLMRRLNGSANVVNCDDVQYVQRSDGVGWDIYIRMELLTPLIKALPECIPEQTVRKLGKDLCKALALCRHYNIIHRDIKPQNIFVSDLGDYKLGDFGIAKTIEKTMGGTKTGTYRYMAPEVYNNRPYGHSADVYSLGLVLYWMLNRRRLPFAPLPPAKQGIEADLEARSRRLSGETPPPPLEGSEALKRIVLRACAYDPKERYHTAEEMLRDLEALDREPAPAPPVQTSEDAPQEAAASGEDRTVGISRDRRPAGTAPNQAAVPAPASESGETVRQTPPVRPAVPAPASESGETVRQTPPVRPADPAPASESGETVRQPPPARPAVPAPAHENKANKNSPASSGKKKPKTGLFAALGAAAVLVLVLLLWRPWASDDRSGASQSGSQAAPSQSGSPIFPVQTESTPVGGGSSANAGQSVSPAGTYDVTVFVSGDLVSLTEAQIKRFNQENTDGITFRYTVAPASETDALDSYLNNRDSLGDLFCFAQDQLARLVQVGALDKPDLQGSSFVRNSSSESAVSAGMLSGTVWAYPMTADNTYFLYYDKSVIPEDAVSSMDALLAVCEESGKALCFDTANAWYVSSYFFGAGCVSEWSADSQGRWTANDSFNSAAGIVAMKGLHKLMCSPAFVADSSAGKFSESAAAVVSGTWDSGTARSILGDNMGVAPLPHYTVDGKDYDLIPFIGCKLMGVKTQTDAAKAAALHKLAQYLTDEEAQLERHAAVGWGPSNKSAQASEAIRSDPVLSAVSRQAQNAVPQGQIHNGWWQLAAALAAAAGENADEAAYAAALQSYADGLKGLESGS